MITRILCPLLALSALCPIDAVAQSNGPAGPRGPLQLDVAGVRLGMPIGQVRSVLAGKYECNAPNMTSSFAQKVADEVKRRRTGASGIRWGGGQGVGWQECVGPKGEILKIDFAQVAAGDVVDKISFALPYDKFDQKAMMAAVLARFGKPTMPGKYLWCDAGYRCDRGEPFLEGPRFSLDSFASAVRVYATRGDRVRKAEANALIAAADRQAPKSSTAAF